MSKYTLNFYEWASGMLDKVNPSYTEVKEKAIDLVFSSGLPFYTDEPSKINSFKEKFVDYFMFQEIGLETPNLFVHRLYSLLNSEMPYFTQLYNSLISNINDLKTSDIFVEEKNRNNESARNNTNTYESSTTSKNESKDSETNTTNSTTTDSANNNQQSQNLRSDEPQSTITSNAYASVLERNENIVTESSSGSSNVSNTIEKTNTANNSLNNSFSENRKENSVENGTENITHNRTTSDNVVIYKAYRDMILNIDKMIIEKCECLFMQIF